MGEVKVGRKFHNSAIGSWSGYIYQGVCAVYAVVHYLYEDINKYDGYKVYLDAFDDFSIHDESGIIVSLHQCKVYADNSKHEEAITQMMDNHNILKREVRVHENAKLWFHTNNDIAENDQVKRYVDFENKNRWNEKELDSSMKKLIEKIILKLALPVHVMNILPELYSFIDHKVIEIHDEYMEGKKRLWELARDTKCAISFSEIKDMIIKDVYQRSEEQYFWQMFKFSLIHHIKNYVDQFVEEEDWEELNGENFVGITDIISNLDLVNIKKVIARTHPSEDIQVNQETYHELANSQDIKELFEVVGKCVYKIGDKFHWNEKEKFEIPITFGTRATERTFLRAMDKNMPNLDFLREFDWIVSHKFKNSTDNYMNLLPKVTETELSDDEIRAERDNILKPKYIGVLKLDDFNNGNF